MQTVFSYCVGFLMLLCASAFADEATQSREAMAGTGVTESSAQEQNTGASQSAQTEQVGEGAQGVESKADIAARIQAIVSSPESTYVEPSHCLPVFAYDTVEILNDQMLVFHGRQKDKLWLNQLAGRCPGLRKNMTLKFELHQDQACNLDTFNGVERTFWFWQNITGSCSLGKFQPVTPDQVNMVKEAIASSG